PPVPVAHVGIGPLHKKDIVTASIMHEHRPEFATILAFDVKVTPEARDAAVALNVTIFTAAIIYHLTDQFDVYIKNKLAARQAASAADAVFPAVCKIVASFNARDPIVLGVDVLKGKLRIGTPLCVVLGGPKVPAAGAGEEIVVKALPNVLEIGRVASMEQNHVAVDSVAAGSGSVAVKIVQGEGQQLIQYGRHFDQSHTLYSRITRTSIDLLKENFRDEMTKDDWKTVVKMKEMFGID
ncbi:hypothetical protein EON68_04185, partial [archaeon]